MEVRNIKVPSVHVYNLLLLTVYTQQEVQKEFSFYSQT